MSSSIPYINKRVVRNACKLYFELGTAPLIHCLVEFIQIYTPCEISQKYLINPYKNLLLALTGASDITRKGLVEIIGEVQNGPLSKEWGKVLKITLEDQNKEDISSRDMSDEIGDITLPDVSLDLQEEIKNLTGVVHEMNKSFGSNSQLWDETINQVRASPTKSTVTGQRTDENPLDLRTPRPNRDRSFLDESLDPKGPDFKNVLHSTLDESLENAVNLFLSGREGSLNNVRKIVVPKMTPRRKLPVSYHPLRPEPMHRLKPHRRVDLDTLGARVDEGGVFKDPKGRFVVYRP